MEDSDDSAESDVTSESIQQNPNENRALAGTKFGQNLWLEVERWRATNTKARLKKHKLKNDNGAMTSGETKDNSALSDELQSPVLKKARHAWQVKSTTGNIKKKKTSNSQTSSTTSESSLSTGKFKNSKSRPCNEDLPTVHTSNVNTETGICSQPVADVLPVDGLACVRLINVLQGSSCAPNSQLGESSSSEMKPAKTLGEECNCTGLVSEKDPNPPYLQKWQKKHLAKAVVDNAVNKTLSELGLSPDSDFGQLTRRSEDIEHQGVSTAIKMRGLQRRTSEPSEAAYIFQKLAPVVDRFNDATERFSFNGMFHLVGSLSTNPIPCPLLAAGNQNRPQTLPRNSENPLGTRDIGDQLDDAGECNNGTSPDTLLSEAELTNEPSDTTAKPHNNSTSSKNCENNDSVSVQTTNSENRRLSETEILRQSDGSMSEGRNPGSCEDILDHALNAAIIEKGLKF